MTREEQSDALRATVVVAAVYAYFLIFAQFAFLDLLESAGMPHGSVKPVLAMMVAGGMAGGFVAARRIGRGAGAGILRRSLATAALVAALALHVRGWLTGMLVSAATGVALGMATVALAARLREWLRGPNAPLWVGIGTGLGYALCNLPCVFAASPMAQAWAACGIALVGAVAVPPRRECGAPLTVTPAPRFLPWLAVFLALVWLDSAAFWVIQHQSELKGGTWLGEWRLWRNAAIHLVGGIAAGWWLSRGGLRALGFTAFGLLGAAGIAVNHAATREIGGLFYPMAVSLYSTALVAWPSLLSGAPTPAARARKAAWLFAVAGWFGSANGIGMATQLQRVPPVFVAIAAAMVLLALGGPPLRRRWREMLAVLLVAGLAAAAWPRPAFNPNLPAAARGHDVYVAEGCLHCHSRYVRPNSRDEAVWGSASLAVQVTKETPVLIGNRRHGPDLAHVGGRRSENWLRLHFRQPRALNPASVMPSYAHLFEDSRGNDLIAFLRVGAGEAAVEVLQRAALWRPDLDGHSADPDRGRRLFQRHCAACHGPEGTGDGPLAREFAKAPADLTKPPFVWSAPRPDEPRAASVARIIKFGISVTDMPGHETMSDADVIDVARWVTDRERAAP